MQGIQAQVIKTGSNRLKKNWQLVSASTFTKCAVIADDDAAPNLLSKNHQSSNSHVTVDPGFFLIGP